MTDPTTDPILNEQFDQTDPSGSGVGGANGGTGAAATDLRRLSDVPMELSVEIGRTHITVGETLLLRAGSVVTLDRLAGEPVDMLVNGTPIAHGEVVVVDEQFGLRVTQILEGDPAAHSPSEQPPPPPAAEPPPATATEDPADNGEAPEA